MRARGVAPDIYGGKDPADLPAYPMREVAHFLWVPGRNLHRWSSGYAVDGKSYPPLISLADSERGLLSFNNLAELHLLSAMRRNIPLQQLRQAIAYLRRAVVGPKHPHPLLAVDLQTDGVSLFIKHLDDSLLNITRDGQIAFREVFEAHLRRVERDPNKVKALRFFPFVRPPKTRAAESVEEQLYQPLSVSIDPRVSFGRPVLAGTRVPTAELAERFSAGEPIISIAEDLSLEPQQIEEAIRYQLADRAA